MLHGNRHGQCVAVLFESDVYVYTLCSICITVVLVRCLVVDGLTVAIILL